MASDLAQVIEREFASAPRYLRNDRARPLLGARLPEALARLMAPLLWRRACSWRRWLALHCALPARSARMHWLFLLIGFAILVMSFLTTNTVVMVLCWLVALVLFGLWLAAMYSGTGGQPDATSR